ncbi:MAG TPA: 50S ribosomal protein L11 methyltransferase [Candidatus Limiplasma sp.]|nr:50S ribosomal protein L11 methyltransferase [Candidatus Limiplasma sp.]HPS80725.1 50S ribosomal protein L11 methyltransferase [Candidatus Limiplasma sp.]
MQWCEAIVHTTTEGSDIVSDMMMRFGATGTEIVDRADVPDPNQPGVYWELYDPKMLADMPTDVLVKGWFTQDEHTHDVLGNLRQQLASLADEASGLDFGALSVDVTQVADEDWAENWKKYYKPFRVGSRLIVKPSWEPYSAKPGDLVVELDPGMAFGTGTHETTYMCMELLEKYLQTGMRVMDVGTGSGILAIAAAKLGAENILAVDIDPDAVRVATENVKHNRVEPQVRVAWGDLVKSEAIPCELAVANIVADAIRMLCGPLTRHLLPGGLLICSGIIREREADVMAAITEAGYTLVERCTKGEWVALCLKNEAARA